jgi:hypothetical protein
MRPPSHVFRLVEQRRLRNKGKIRLTVEPIALCPDTGKRVLPRFSNFSHLPMLQASRTDIQASCRIATRALAKTDSPNPIMSQPLDNTTRSEVSYKKQEHISSSSIQISKTQTCILGNRFQDTVNCGGSNTYHQSIHALGCCRQPFPRWRPIQGIIWV